MKILKKPISLFSIVFFVSAFVFVVSSLYEFDVPNKLQTANKKTKTYKGILGGKKLSIPSEYIKFPVVYVGESIWNKNYDPDKFGENAQIQNFTLEVRWPLFEPVKAIRQLASNSGVNETFLTISPYAWPAKPLISIEGGLTRHLERLLERPFESSKNSGLPLFSKGIHYVVRGIDDELSLMQAMPVGSGSEIYFMQNDALYWAENSDAQVTTLIKCQNGKMKNEKSRKKCTHIFIWPELKIFINLYYRKSMLVHWKELEEKSRQLILSFSYEK